MVTFDIPLLTDIMRCHEAMAAIDVDMPYQVLCRVLGIKYLGTVDASVKAIHSSNYGTKVFYVYLLPSTGAGHYIGKDNFCHEINVCPNSLWCHKNCLAESGQARLDLAGGVLKIHRARLLKTKLLHERPDIFMKMLEYEIQVHRCMATLDHFDFAVRLNTSSDINWTKVNMGNNIYHDIIAKFPNIQFYDYTKVSSYMALAETHPNYHLTLSFNGYNENTCTEALNQGHSVAVVFYGKIPDEFWGYPVINGDKFDMRYYDREFFGLPKDKGYIVGLKYKPVNGDFVSGHFVAPSKDNKFIVHV